MLRNVIGTQKVLAKSDRRNLRDYIRLVLGFYCCLVLFAIYQNMALYSSGVLDSVLNSSLLLQLLHHAGFAALAGLLLAFVFNTLEARKPGLGFALVRIIFIGLLTLEGILISYYTKHYVPMEALGSDWLQIWKATPYAAIFLAVSLVLIRVFYFLMAKVYAAISKMYPFTIVLFSLFLASLLSAKRPVNENKTQHLIESIANEIRDYNTYDGTAEYPLLHPYKIDAGLGQFFKLKEAKPNFVILIVDGLGSDFLGVEGRYTGFTPFLDSLARASLYWPNFFSNTGVSHAALPSITGSLPFGECGFTGIDHRVQRHTLYGILKKNGYNTSFSYGGNSAINQWDRFLSEEHVDFILDSKGFDGTYQKQQNDAAGISLGYPDKELFRRWLNEKRSYEQPRLDLIVTLSSRKPFLAPQQEAYMKKVDALADTKKERRIKRLIRNNREIFASILYTDDALRYFFRQYATEAAFGNTIFLITGSHNMTDLPQENNLDLYRVPLLIYSPLLLKPVRMNSLASHADLLPALVGLLGNSFPVGIPGKVAWLGEGLGTEGALKRDNPIPLFPQGKDLQGIIKGNNYFSRNTLYEFNERFALKELSQDSIYNEFKEQFRAVKTAANYVLRENKLIPPSEYIFESQGFEPGKEALVWIQSVFNGSDYDNAYNKAKELAFQGQTNRAMLLARYILSKVPGHADTEILMGRMYAWQGDYRKASEILTGAIHKYPVYADGYAALLDVYYWSGQREKAISLAATLRSNGIKNREIDQKMERAYQMKPNDSLRPISLNDKKQGGTGLALSLPEEK